MIRPFSNLIDPQEVLEAAEESEFGMEAIGFCLGCGAENYGVEPAHQNSY